MSAADNLALVEEHLEEARKQIVQAWAFRRDDEGMASIQFVAGLVALELALEGVRDGMDAPIPFVPTVTP